MRRTPYRQPKSIGGGELHDLGALRGTRPPPPHPARAPTGEGKKRWGIIRGNPNRNV